MSSAAGAAVAAVRARLHRAWSDASDVQRIHQDLIAADGAHLTATYAQLLAQLQPNAPTGQSVAGSEPAESFAQRLQDAAWKQLHSGHWAAAPIIWRRLYERAGLAAVVLQLANSDASGDASATAASIAALRTLDLCLLMGSQENTAAIQTLVAELESKGAVADTPTTSPATCDRADQPASPSPPSPAPHTCADAAVAAAAAPIPPLPCPPVLPSSAFASPLPRLKLPSLQMFERACMAARVPTIVEGAMDSWPCMAEPEPGSGAPDRRWSNLSYLRRVCGRRTVPVEIGGNYLSEDWSQELMTMDDFMQQHIFEQGEAKEHEKSAGPAETTTAAAAGAPPRPIGYLAQHRLLEQVPALRNDLLVPDYCLLTSPGDPDADPDPPQLMAWFGPAGTVSPLHTDPTHNLLAQVVGSKYVRLYSAEHTRSLYPSSELANTSLVDAERVDADRFPLARELPYFEGVLEPGCMLYIPPKCWHYIRSLSVSFSVSFWWG